jgi:lipopolysaccharide assembly protein A
MRSIYWAIVLIAAAVVSVFAASNREIVSLGLWPLPYAAEVPLYLLVLAALLLGTAIGVFVAWIRGSRRRRELRECRRQNTALARELAATQAQLSRESRPVQQAITSPR